jgi:hypothetical protein
LAISSPQCWPPKWSPSIAGRNLKAPTTKDPAPGQGESKDATERMLQLTPRMIQDSKLAFRLTSNDLRNNDIYQVADANPICGGIVLNHLDTALSSFDTTCQR